MSRNIVDDYINYDRDNVKEYINIITNNELNEDYVNNIVKTFIDVRYYDLYDHVVDSPIDNIGYYTKVEAEKYLVDTNNKISKTKLKRNVDNALWLIKYVLLFEKITSDKKLSKLLSELDEKVKSKFSISGKNKEKLFNLIQENAQNKKRFIKRTSSNDFNIQSANTNIVNVYDCIFENSIQIPDLFSQSAIERVYNESIIAEDKLLVEYTMASVKVLEDIIKFNYDSSYLIDFNMALLSKKNKLNALLNIIDNDLLKEKLNIKINYVDYLENKDKINNLIHDGYKFCVILPPEFKSNTQLLSLFSYIILDDKLENHPDLEKFDNVILKELIGVEI